MISFEITHSPTLEILGQHSYEFNKVNLGNALSSHLIINDPKVNLKEITIFIKEDQAFIEGPSLNTFYMVNGKKISGRKLININDEIEIGDTKIILLEYRH